MDFELIKAALDLAAVVFERLVHANKETRDQWRTAVGSLQRAVLDTQVYVASLDRGGAANRQTEAGLVAAWRDAAGGFYGLDGDLADRLQLKATYWTEPQAWTSQQVRDADISLQHVAEYTRQLLREGPTGGR